MTELRPCITIDFKDISNGEQFRRLFESYPGEPVLIKRVLSQEQLKNWTIPEITKRAGHIPVNVDIFPDGSYKAHTAGYQAGVEMPLAEYFERLRNQAEHPEVQEKIHMCDIPIYLQPHCGKSTPLAQALCPPELFESDIKQTFSLVDMARHHSTLTFFGHNSRSPTHYHTGTHTFLIQLHGAKKLYMYPPSPGLRILPRYYYDMFVYKKLPDECRQNPTHGIFGQMPYRMEVTVEPGDMFFIPLYWWHDVYGDNYTITMSHFYSAKTSQFWSWPSIRIIDILNFTLRLITSFFNNKGDKGRMISQKEKEKQKKAN